MLRRESLGSWPVFPGIPRALVSPGVPCSCDHDVNWENGSGGGRYTNKKGMSFEVVNWSQRLASEHLGAYNLSIGIRIAKLCKILYVNILYKHL